MVKEFFVTDHTGTVFMTEEEMCALYNVTVFTYKGRRARGWSVEKALTYQPVDTRVTDHEGNEYPSKAAMCREYNINVRTYRGRLDSGMSQEEALTMPVNVRRSNGNGIVQDHLGNEYASIGEMCEHYGISREVFNRRMKKMSLEESLTKPIVNAPQVTYDHLGNEYPSFSKMCEAYNRIPKTVRNALDRGMSLEEALTYEVNIGIGQKERLSGQWRLMKCGLKATVIDYITNVNMTVVFENGDVLYNVRTDAFMDGNLKP